MHLFTSDRSEGVGRWRYPIFKALCFHREQDHPDRWPTTCAVHDRFRSRSRDRRCLRAQAARFRLFHRQLRIASPKHSVLSKPSQNFSLSLSLSLSLSCSWLSGIRLRLRLRQRQRVEPSTTFPGFGSSGRSFSSLRPREPTDLVPI